MIDKDQHICNLDMLDYLYILNWRYNLLLHIQYRDLLYVQTNRYKLVFHLDYCIQHWLHKCH